MRFIYILLFTLLYSNSLLAWEEIPNISLIGLKTGDRITVPGFNDIWEVKSDTETRIQETCYVPVGKTYCQTAYSRITCCTQDSEDEGRYIYNGHIDDTQFIKITPVTCPSDKELDIQSNTCVCPSGEIEDENGTCVAPTCTDTPPDNWLEYPTNPDGGCAEYIDELMDIFATQGSAVCNLCYAPPYDEHTCLSPKVLVYSDFENVPPTCELPDDVNTTSSDDVNTTSSDDDNTTSSDDDNTTSSDDESTTSLDDESTTSSDDSTCSSLSDDVLSLNSDLCSGNQVYMSPYYYSSITYQTCDSTCYGLEKSVLTCDQIYNIKVSSCNLSDNTFNFSCSSTAPENYTSSCVSSATLCNEKYDEVMQTCSENEIVVGFDDCLDNGLDVTSDSIHCAPDTTISLIADCTSLSNEIFNSSSNTCICKDGYSRNVLLECTQDIDNNTTESDASTSEDITTSEESTDSNTTSLLSSDMDSNTTSISDTTSDSNLSSSVLSTLDGLRADSNTTNSLLSSINDKLDSNSSSDDANFGSYDDEQSDLLGVISSAKKGLDDIKDDYEVLLSKLKNGMDISPTTSGSSPVFSTTVFHRELSINLCDTFSLFYPIFYYVFTFAFLFFGVRIFIFSFMIGW